MDTSSLVPAESDAKQERGKNAHSIHMLATLIALQTAHLMTSDLDLIARNAFVNTKVALPNEKLSNSDVSITILQINRRDRTWTAGSFEGNVPMYPASVVKLFWLAFLAHRVESGHLKLTSDDQRAAKEMIEVSNNDATGAIVNLTTGALPGPELAGQAYEAWVARRMQANRWFSSLGYENLNVLNRTYNEGPFGREAQIIREKGRNALTTDGTARLMAEIALDKIVNDRQCSWMRGLLRRDIPADNPKADDQSFGFLGEVMPKGTKHWSKAGWTSEVRHDVSYDLMPDGNEFVFCVFTKRPNNKLVLQTLGMEILRQLGYNPHPPRTGPEAATD